MRFLKLLVGVISVFSFFWNTPAKAQSIDPHFSVVPEYCHDSHATIQCFRLCEGNIRQFSIGGIHENYAKYVELVQNAEQKNGTEEDIERLALDCKHRCETDPYFWTCVEECDRRDPTVQWDKVCRRPCTDFTDFSSEDCRTCLYDLLKIEIKRTCEIAQYPNHPDALNLCEKLSTCATSGEPTLTESEYNANFKDFLWNCTSSSNSSSLSLDMVKMCANDILMLNQRKCCYSQAYRNARVDDGCGSDDPSCDKLCLPVFSPRLCYERCRELRDERILHCKKSVDERYPIEIDPCLHCKEDHALFLAEKNCVDACFTMDCAMECIKPSVGPPVAQTPSTTSSTTRPIVGINATSNGTNVTSSGNIIPRARGATTITPNGTTNTTEIKSPTTSTTATTSTRRPSPAPASTAYNARHMRINCRLHEYLLAFYKLREVEDALSLSLIDVDNSEWIPSHITPLECKDTSPCLEQTEKVLDGAERKKACNANPFRAIDFLACAAALNYTSLSSKIVLKEDLTIFPEYTETCLEMSEPLRLKLYKLTYRFEQQAICEGVCSQNTSLYHPIIRQNSITKVDACQPIGRSKYCKPQSDAYLVELTDFATCRWDVDFSRTENPYILMDTYFNELSPLEAKTKLEHPDTTNILQRAKYNGKVDFFAFPYFLILRSKCDKGGYYDDEGYQLFMSGGRPTISLKYRKPSNRHVAAHIQGFFDAALMKLKRRTNDDLIPKNPQSIDGDLEELSCHEKICYPAFAIPLIFLHFTNFLVLVSAHGMFSELRWSVYVNPFHARTVEGQGEIQIAAEDVPAHAGMLFPNERADFATDMELALHLACTVRKNLTAVRDVEKAEICPELVHRRDDFANLYKSNEFLPLDAEDVFRSQYTFGTSPVQAIAGFYDPRLLIIGDADMNKPIVVRWGSLLKSLEGRTDLHSCVQPTLSHRGNAKPIYSRLDKSDPPYPIKYYRMRYAHLKFDTEPTDTVDKYAETGIFEAIGLEDRLLLVTNKGLVSFYGHTNATVAKDLPWKFEEVLNRCFKIVRILPRAQPNVDLIVGITYDYKTENGEEITQEVWIGRFTFGGEKIEWVQLKANPIDNIFPEERVVDKEKPRGALLPMPHWKNPLFHGESREANPNSQIESICFKAFRSELKKYSSKIHVVDSTGWCEAIDATPVQMKENALQVLVRMRVLHDSGAQVYFYVVASHIFHKSGQATAWTINSILPRYPCLNDHTESIDNVFQLDKQYFGDEVEANDPGLELTGCYQAGKGIVDNHIFLHGMTYTKSLTTHLFLYGSRLLQSSNHGKNFIFLRSFPQRLHHVEDNFFGPTDPRSVHSHRIIRMAFDNGGHYAFLTNKRELWLGTTGSIYQIRLRPSPLQSMVQLGISKEKNLNDGIPFIVDFDSHDELYEMVAIPDDQGDISRVMKRPVGEWKMLGIQTVLEKLKGRSEKITAIRKERALPDHLQGYFHYDTAEWSSYCPFLSPNLKQNFSIYNSRTIGMIFPHPTQHLQHGLTHKEGSLMAYQVAAFSLVWKTIFEPYTRSPYYAGYHKDPFRLWKDVKKREEIIGMLQFVQGNPEETGILVHPSEHKLSGHLVGVESSLIFTYWLDYYVVVELRLEFSVKNDYLVKNRAFEMDEFNKVQLNVENANGSVIQVNTEKDVFPHNASVLFIIRMSLKNRAGLGKNLPGLNLLPVPVTYHLIGAFGNCVNNKAHGVIGDRINSVVQVGCPTSRIFVFDWNATLRSIHLRGDRIEGKSVQHGVGELCHNHEFACFFSRTPMVFHFAVYDESKQVHYPYLGKYVMRIIGGGRDRHKILPYSPEEIEAFNIPGVSDVSLIWNEWDTENHQKVERKLEVITDRNGEPVQRDNRELVLQSGVSTIMWACNTLSPCARISPSSDFEVDFWFRMFITNRDVDNSTLCLFEKEFDIMLYGFPPAPEYQLLFTLGSSCLIMSILYLLFICCRRQARFWRHTKSNVKNWYFIVKDVIPKKLRMYELPIPDEEKLTKSAKKHKKKGSIENLYAGHSGSSVEDDEESLDPSRRKGSLDTIESVDATGFSPGILPQAGHNLSKSARDIAYDQILSRRLNSIVERNRTMRVNLLKKASLNQSGWDFELEDHFEKQFGRTASQESLFTPPLPKDRKGGIDTFI